MNDKKAEQEKVEQANAAEETEESPIERNEFREALLNELSDPDVAAKAIEMASQSPRGRQLLNIPAGKGEPLGHYARNYKAEPSLRVTGGLEVEHDRGFRPLPPSYIHRYVRNDGAGATDYEEEARVNRNGELEMTPEYKHWLDLQMEGSRLSGKVRSDIQAGSFQPDDPGLDIG